MNQHDTDDEHYNQCNHPAITITVPDKTEGPILQATCTTCEQTETGSMLVQYGPIPILVAGIWMPLTVQRGNIAVCAKCNQLIFPELHPIPIILFIHGPEGNIVGQVDLCAQCGANLPLVQEEK